MESDELGIHATALFKKPQIKVFTYKNDEESNLQIVQVIKIKKEMAICNFFDISLLYNSG